MTDEKENKSIPAAPAAGNWLLEGASSVAKSTVGQVEGMPESGGADLVQSYRRFHDPESADEFYQLALMAPVLEQKGEAMLKNPDHDWDEQDHRMFEQYRRYSSLLVKFEVILVAKLKRQELEAEGLEDGMPIDAPRRLINHALWEELKLDVANSTARGAGKSIRSIRIFEMPRAQRSKKREDERPYLSRHEMRQWMLVWYENRRTKNLNMGFDDYCWPALKEDFPNHRIGRDFARDVWREMLPEKLKPGPKPDRKRS